MLFIEKKNYIKSEKSKNTSYIKLFYQKFHNKNKFFLRIEDWDNFSTFMAENYPSIIIEYDYPTLED